MSDSCYFGQLLFWILFLESETALKQQQQFINPIKSLEHPSALTWDNKESRKFHPV